MALLFFFATYTTLKVGVIVENERRKNDKE